MSCEVCLEKFNKSNHREINCIFCDKIACKMCWQEYLLKHGWNDCMYCKKDFPLSFLYLNFPKKWCNDEYLKKYGEICYQLEQQYFLQNHNPTQNKTVSKQSTLLTNCPNNKCKGILDKDKNKCSICDKLICVRCMKFDSENHKCDEEDLSNILIAKSSKNCPTCNITIFKSSGCDHMFCTQCHTMFNWSDLRITKTTTNPHYYEWLRSQGITPARSDRINNCNILSAFDCQHILQHYHLDNDYILVNVARLPHVLNQKYINNNELVTLREYYLTNTITEEKFKQRISKIYIIHHFRREYNLLVINVVNTISDIFHLISDECKKLSDKYSKISIAFINDIKNQLNNMREIYNTEVEKQKKYFNNFSLYVIDNNFNIQALVNKLPKTIQNKNNECINLLSSLASLYSPLLVDSKCSKLDNVMDSPIALKNINKIINEKYFLNEYGIESKLSNLISDYLQINKLNKFMCENKININIDEKMGNKIVKNIKIDDLNTLIGEHLKICESDKLNEIYRYIYKNFNTLKNGKLHSNLNGESKIILYICQIFPLIGLNYLKIFYPKLKLNKYYVKVLFVVNKNNYLSKDDLIKLINNIKMFKDQFIKLLVYLDTNYNEDFINVQKQYFKKINSREGHIPKINYFGDVIDKWNCLYYLCDIINMKDDLIKILN